MDGTHDIGGRQGFGPVTVEGNRVSFHEDWEKRINAVNGALVGKHIYNMDEYRHAIERMEPRHYFAASYFERVFTAVVTLCVEKGIFDAQALAAQAQENVPLALPSPPGRTAGHPAAEFAVGSKVRVKQQFVAGHTRMPAYVRGHVGTVVRVSPPYPFPDAAAHGLSADRQPTCDVLFNAADLWPGAEPNEVCVGLFVSYLEPA
jgi:nitrile hydratase